MGDRRSCAAAVGGALAIVLVCLGAVAEDNQLIATVERPAIVTAAVAPSPGASLADRQVVVSVVAYKPSRDGAVQGVVKVQKNEGGTEQEIGRFGIFPNAEFRAADPSQARRYSFPLPTEVARGSPIKLKVEVVPVRGEGKDAQLEIGSAEIK
ncbi:MAG: hypothetical protein ACJ8F0_19250 [Xanthobacteraceae bacterium]|jgi:hypothetical protein